MRIDIHDPFGRKDRAFKREMSQLTTPQSVAIAERVWGDEDPRLVARKQAADGYVPDTAAQIGRVLQRENNSPAARRWGRQTLATAASNMANSFYEFAKRHPKLASIDREIANEYRKRARRLR